MRDFPFFLADHRNVNGMSSFLKYGIMMITAFEVLSNFSLDIERGQAIFRPLGNSLLIFHPKRQTLNHFFTFKKRAVYKHKLLGLFLTIALFLAKRISLCNAAKSF